MAVSCTPQDLKATLNYYGGQTEFWAGTVGEKRRKHTAVETVVKDMRGCEDAFELDTHGFQLVHRPSTEKVFDDDEKIKSSYYDECSRLLKDVTGASQVHIMSHVVRRTDWNAAFDSEKHLGDNERSLGGPTSANFIHVDQSYDGAPLRIAEAYPEVAKSLEGVRWAIVNLWRPVSTITRNALAVSDARSVPESDLVEVLARFPGRELTEEERKSNLLPKGGDDPFFQRPPFGTWAVHPPKSDEHKWYYASNMNPDEVLMLKIFDSSKKGPARRSPHTSFRSAGDHGPPRESIEVRSFIIWPEQTCE